jgi:hypothetical protein
VRSRRLPLFRATRPFVDPRRRRAIPVITTSAAMPEPRRFPPPWSAEETDACFVVRNADGPRLGVRVWASGGRFAQHRTANDSARGRGGVEQSAASPEPF